MSRKVCLYSGNDLDGISSAAIIKQKYPDVVLHSLSYDELFHCENKIQPGDDVTIVNIALQPFSKMIECNKRCNLTWITHSDTSIDEYEEALENGDTEPISGILDKTRASCEMTWKHFFPDISMPYTIWLLGKYGVWDYEASPSVLPFQFGMKLDYREPDDMVFWGRVFTANRDGRFIHDIMNSGFTIIKYRTRLNEKLCEVQSFESTILNHKCICMNRGMCGSLVFESVWDSDKYDLMIVFYIDDGGAWNVSLYTDKSEVDVGKIAKSFGGGGSACAAGFRSSILPFDIVG